MGWLVRSYPVGQLFRELIYPTIRLFRAVPVCFLQNPELIFTLRVMMLTAVPFAATECNNLETHYWVRLKQTRRRRPHKALCALLFLRNFPSLDGKGVIIAFCGIL